VEINRFRIASFAAEHILQGTSESGQDFSPWNRIFHYIGGIAVQVLEKFFPGLIVFQWLS